MTFIGFLNESNKTGKRLRDGVYIQSFAIDNGDSNLKEAELELYKTRRQQLPEDFQYDFVFVGNDKTIRFMKMNSLEEAHPYVTESIKFSPSGEMSKGKIGNQIYHRMDTMISPSYPSYKFHEEVTKWEESKGLFNFDGRTPSGSLRVYKQQVETKMPWEEYEKGIEDLKQRFLK